MGPGSALAELACPGRQSYSLTRSNAGATPPSNRSTARCCRRRRWCGRRIAAVRAQIWEHLADQEAVQAEIPLDPQHLVVCRRETGARRALVEVIPVVDEVGERPVVGREAL